MKLHVKEFIDADKANYQYFLHLSQNQTHQTFFHSWEWGEVMQARNKSFVRFGVYNTSGALVAVGQAAQQPLKAGSFWYCPRGLCMDYSQPSTVVEAYKAAVTHFKRKNGAAFFRTDPNIVQGDALEHAIDSLKPKKAAIFTQVERCWMLELQQDDPDGTKLIAWMKEHGARKKISYYLRKGTRDGVVTRVSTDMDDLEKFLGLLNKLHSRKGGIGKHTDDYYRTQFGIMAPAGYQKLFIAEKDGELLAASLMGIYGNEASYLHAASSGTHSDLAAPHSLHFETMKYLQANYPDVKYYNFWGVVGDKNRTPKHPRHGYSEFKRSFGGYKVKYMRTRDFVSKPHIWAAAYALDKYRTWKYKND